MMLSTNDARGWNRAEIDRLFYRFACTYPDAFLRISDDQEQAVMISADFGVEEGYLFRFGEWALAFRRILTSIPTKDFAVENRFAEARQDGKSASWRIQPDAV